ncbi:MAG: alpha/beta hydrolase [Rhodocyclaceae bacterium]
MPLHPKARMLLDMLGRIDAPRLYEQPLDVARHNYHKLLFAYRGELEPVDAIHDFVLPRKDIAGGPLRARIYRPHADGALPVLLWFHGGGWTLGDLAGYDGVCRALARRAGCAVLAVDYRLAPEHTFPAAVDDAWLAWRWVLKEGAGHGLDAGRVTIAGDSAGGNLAATLCLMVRDAGGMLPVAQVLAYPATDQLSEAPSHHQWGDGYFLDRPSLAWFQRNYLPAASDLADWRASPARAASHAGLPPTLVITAGFDPLSDDGAAYGELLRSAGVAVRHRHYARMIHGFLSMPKLFEDAEHAIEDIVAMIKDPGQA